jgi:hypothetical protein
MPKQRREFQKEKSVQHRRLSVRTHENPEAPAWTDEGFRYFPVIGIALIVFCTLIIYGQTILFHPSITRIPFTSFIVRMSM